MNFARQSGAPQAPDGLPLVPSLALLTAIVAFALVGLALDHNRAKLVRVGAAFAVYAGALLLARSRAGAAWRGFGLAGLSAGTVSGLLQAAPSGLLLAAQAGGGVLIGTAHWLGLHLWRRIRRGLQP